MSGRGQTKLRTCIVTRQTQPASEMLRFVLGPDGSMVFDVKARLPGRGVWVSASKSHLARAVKKGLFARAVKEKVGVQPDLVVATEQQLRSAALGSLGLARKAGQVIVGFASVEAAIRKGGLAALIHASDGAEDGRRKLANAVRATAPEMRPAETVTNFTASELSLALGRANVIHAAAMMGHAGDMFVTRARMVANFCADLVEDAPKGPARKLEPHSQEAAI